MQDDKPGSRTTDAGGCPETDEERRAVYGWCPQCGCGNDQEGYAHLPTCPTQRTRTALERAEDAIARAHCYFDFGLNACATEIAVEINAAIAAERDRCAKIARNGATFFRDKPIKFVTPEKYAADLADDIADAIESGAQP